ncbi:response regulator [Amphiplicatus metriothermophilus]|uniref:Response regulator receiver domain-containing protein n=1 Tax=Amphiplicatus metriothermophilus TaxID=1519374 RepID=A0A239PYS4_9PROT|nr:response regulator [Amphiplicatus metriothermophilus]MBB5518217.1 CheY-like chemotaxis protein [Amphiplicatus metriothermophilus]SNT75404.1 Response regulator receiver domain-containing protein [Amphiplicatus metriothermophilus]
MTRVLVVDDLEVNVLLLKAKLSAANYSVLCAESGARAIETARTEHPDIILLDVMMPGMDGYQACKILKDTPETSGIPVVMVTALDGEADREAGLRAGADGYVTKPVNDKVLFRQIEELTQAAA